MIGEVITSNWNKTTPVDKIKLVDFSISKYTTPIRYFNSIAETVANLDYDKKPKYYDPKSTPVIVGCYPAEIFLEALEQLQNVTKARAIAAKVGMNMYATVNGKTRYFKYYPDKMLLQFRGIKESEAASINKQKQLQTECDLLNAKARKTFDLLVVMSKKPMDADMRKKFVDAVAMYNFSVLEIKQIPGVTVQLKEFKTSTISGIGVIPIVVWAVIAIVAALGVTAIIVDGISKVKTKQMLFDAQIRNLDAIAQADKDFQAGKISKETRDLIQQQAIKNTATNNKVITTLTTEESKSTIDKLTTLAAVAAGGFILYKIM